MLNTSHSSVWNYCRPILVWAPWKWLPPSCSGDGSLAARCVRIIRPLVLLCTKRAPGLCMQTSSGTVSLSGQHASPCRYSEHSTGLKSRGLLPIIVQIVWNLRKQPVDRRFCGLFLVHQSMRRVVPGHKRCPLSLSLLAAPTQRIWSSSLWLLCTETSWNYHIITM